MKTYRINEWFYSLQGEGLRAGTPNVFLRFSGCNLTCKKESEGFDCDTEFVSGKSWTLDELVQNVKEISRDCKWIVLTGGEPTLQIDDALIDRLHNEGFKLAIETNGTNPVSNKIDWITVSPKTAEHAIKQRSAHEVKYVRSYGMGIPKPTTEAKYYLISPAADGDQISQKNIEWCMQLIRENPEWRLSLQLHKVLGIR